jgi:hypothetical protein
MPFAARPSLVSALEDRQTTATKLDELAVLKTGANGVLFIPERV